MRPVIPDLISGANDCSAYPFIEHVEVNESDVQAVVDLIKKRLSVMAIVAWLASKNKKRSTGKALSKSKIPDFEFLSNLVQADSRLSEVFVVKGNGIEFSPNITDREREEIERFAKEHYTPLYFEDYRLTM